MRTRTIFLIMVTLVLSATVSGQGLQGLLDKQAAALGGWKNMKNVKSYLIKSDLEAGGMKGTAVSYYKAPDKYRTDVSLPVSSYSQGCIGENCWMRDNSGLVRPIGDELKQMIVTQAAIESWSYLDSAKFDGAIRLLDTTAAVNGNDCYVIMMRPKGGSEATLYVDKKTNLIDKMSTLSDFGTIHAIIEDYRPVMGVMVPFKSTESTDAGFVAGVSRVTSAEFNAALDDSIFSSGKGTGSEGRFAAGVDSVVIPFELHQNHIYVRAVVNGDTLANFIFDSGAAGVGLDKRLINRLHLVKLGSSEAKGVGGSDSSGVYQLDSIRVGGVLIKAVGTYSMDFEPMTAGRPLQIDGFIGYDILSRYVVTVDYENRNLIVYEKEIEPRNSWGSKCPLTLDFKLPYTRASVNDSIEGRFRIDTGSSNSIDFNAPFVKEHHLIGSDSSQYLATAGYGIGGSTPGLIGALPSLSLCGARLEDLSVSYSISKEGMFAGVATAGNIGGGVLKGFAVTFDYGRGWVYFRPTAAIKLIGRLANMAGIEIEKSGAEIVVTKVYAGRSAEGILHEGDVVRTIDDVDLNGKGVEEINKMLVGSRGTSRTLFVFGDHALRTVKIILDSLY